MQPRSHRTISLSRNGSGSSAGTAARDMEGTLAAPRMPRHRKIPGACWTSTQPASFSGSWGAPGHGEFGPDDIPDDFPPWFADLIRWVNGTVHELEKTAFYDGFHKASGFGGYPCEHQHALQKRQKGLLMKVFGGNAGTRILSGPAWRLRASMFCHGPQYRGGTALHSLQEYGVREDRPFPHPFGRSGADRVTTTGSCGIGAGEPASQAGGFPDGYGLNILR